MFPYIKPPAGTQINPLHPLSKGLVGCWLFNEGAGSLANDISGKGNHGTLTNMSPNVQGSGWGGSQFGGGLGFDSTNDYVDTISNIGISGAASRTISLWMKAGDKNDSQYGQNMVAWGACDTGNFNGIMFDAYDYADEGIKMSSWGYELNGTANTITRGQWHHITAKYDGTAMYIYIDGILDVSGNKTMNTTDGPVRFGHVLACDSYGRNFKGSIDSACIYNRALSAVEIKTLYLDPFCNMMIRRPSGLYVPSAAGLSIPVAMHHYNQLAVA